MSTKMGMSMGETYADFSKMIDHSLLVPTMKQSDLEEGLRVAIAYDVASVCIMPYALPLCVERLSGTTIRPSTTIGFPHGGHTTATKVAEAREAIAHGCQELDAVVNVSRVLSEQWTDVTAEIRELNDVAHAEGRFLKVIFENCYLQDRHKIRLCEICGEIGVDWVKTSTGYGTSGATLPDLALMRKHSPAAVQVKAAGGVRDFATLREIRAMGVSRCGTSRTAEILNECRLALGLPALQMSPAAPSSSY
jgi:deoxyribose-phosphate aldolase